MSSTVVPSLPPDSALPFPHVLRVRASAGSGKTYILALRFAQFLLSRTIPRSLPENILAITFTRAATAQMRSRVLDRLKKAALGDDDSVKGLTSLVSMPPEAVSKEAERVVDELVFRYDSFQVGTIDSLITRLVKACSLELGLSPALETETHTEPYTVSALDRMLLAAGRDTGLFEDLRDFALHYLDFEGKSGWWPRHALHREFVRFLEIETRTGKGLKSGRPPRTSAILAAFTVGAARFLDLVDVLGMASCLKKTERACIEKAANGDEETFKSKTWQKASAQDLFKKACDVPVDVEDSWQRLRSLAGVHAMALALKRPLPYIRLFRRWKDELAAIKEKRQTIFLGDMNLLARRLTGEIPTSEVLFRLGERIRHVLVDEFQDTSGLQWENLYPILEEAISNGGSLFCVGDTKQILYRWRGSDPRIFDEAPKGFSSVAPGHLLDLDLRHNWRSRMVILDFVADVFNPPCLMAADGLVNELGEEEARRIAAGFAGAAQSVPPGCEDAHGGGYVYVEKTEEIKDFPPWERLVRLLETDILTRRPPGDVMVLLRKNEDVEGVTAALLAVGIPAVSERLLDVRSDPVVREILSFIRFLDQPEDIHLATILSGRIARCAWRRHGPEGITPNGWMESVSVRPNRPAALKNVLRQDLPGLWEALFLPFVRASGSHTVHDLATRMVKTFRIREGFPDAWPSVRRLLSVMHEKEPELGGDPAAFLEWMETAPMDGLLLPMPKDAQAVRVMTIHKSKGLEAPVVVLPKAAIGPRAEGMIREETRDGFRLWQTTKDLRKVSERMARLHARDLKEAWRDELNCLYVALTRAREELHLLVPPKAGNRTNGLLGLIARVAENKADVFTRGERQPGKTACWNRGGPEMSADLLPETEKSERRPWETLIVRRDETGSPFLSPARRKAIRSGEAVHRLLARLTSPIACPPEGDPLAALLSDMLEPWEWDKITTEDLKRIADSLLIPEARPLFWPVGPARIWTEREIADANGELYRIDRLVVTDQKVFVCEYKTGERPRSRDAEQLSRYLAILSSIYQNRSVSGILLYLDAGLSQRVFVS